MHRCTDPRGKRPRGRENHRIGVQAETRPRESAEDRRTPLDPYPGIPPTGPSDPLLSGGEWWTLWEVKRPEHFCTGRCPPDPSKSLGDGATQRLQLRIARSRLSIICRGGKWKYCAVMRNATPSRCLMAGVRQAGGASVGTDWLRKASGTADAIQGSGACRTHKGIPRDMSNPSRDQMSLKRD